LQAYVAHGGSLVVTHKAGLLAGTDRSWLEAYGLHFAQMSPFKPAYFVPTVNMTGEIPPFEYALYEGASQWLAESPATVWAHLGEPLFQRSPEHYTSHAQTPFDHTTGYAALARSGSVALFAFPLGQSYCNQGYWIYRQAFQKVIRELLRSPLIQTNAPMSAELALMHQAPQPKRRQKERHLIHIVNYSPLRHTRKHTDFCEDPTPLTNVAVRLNLPLKVANVRAVVAGEDLAVHRAQGGGVELIVPRVAIHEILSFETV
jgi:hypothetical protein